MRQLAYDAMRCMQVIHFPPAEEEIRVNAMAFLPAVASARATDYLFLPAGITFLPTVATFLLTVASFRLTVAIFLQCIMRLLPGKSMLHSGAPLIVAQLLYQLIVDAQQEEGRCPLPYK